MTANCARSWRCRYSTPFAGPVAPEVKTTAASAVSSSWTSSVPSAAGATRCPRLSSSCSECWAPVIRRRAVGSGRPAILVPGTRIGPAASKPGRSAMTWSILALRSALAIPRRPRPRSTTTMTPPACQTEYSATVSSMDGGTSSATRCPGSTPAARRPAPVSRTLRCRSAQLIVAPADLDDRRGAVVGPCVEPGEDRRRSSCRRVRRPDPAGPVLGRPVAARRAGLQVGDERPDRVGVAGGILGQQVAGLLVAVQLGGGQPLLQVPQVLFEEDRVAWPPEQQRRHIEVRHRVGDPIQRGSARMVCGEGDVGDEVAHRAAQAGPSRRARRTRPGRPAAAAARSATWWSGRTAGSTGRRSG